MEAWAENSTPNRPILFMTKGNQFRPFPFDYGELERLLDYYLETFRFLAREKSSATDECLPKMQVSPSGRTKPAPTNTTRLACVSYKRSFGSKERPHRVSGSFFCRPDVFFFQRWSQRSLCFAVVTGVGWMEYALVMYVCLSVPCT